MHTLKSSRRQTHLLLEISLVLPSFADILATGFCAATGEKISLVKLESHSRLGSGSLCSRSRSFNLEQFVQTKRELKPERSLRELIKIDIKLPAVGFPTPKREDVNCWNRADLNVRAEFLIKFWSSHYVAVICGVDE
jgi:hypothetical protein